jgi:ankyrin repeat protein
LFFKFFSFKKVTIFSQIFFSGNTPLHTAYHTTHNDIAQLLIASGADQKKTNTSGLTPAQLGK